MKKLSVKEWRLIKELSIVKVADAIKVSPVTYAKYEAQPSKMPIEKAEAFCKLVDCKWDEVNFLP